MEKLGVLGEGIAYLHAGDGLTVVQVFGEKQVATRALGGADYASVPQRELMLLGDIHSLEHKLPVDRDDATPGEQPHRFTCRLPAQGGLELPGHRDVELVEHLGAHDDVVPGTVWTENRVQLPAVP